jgi:hypothetical protein
VTAELPDDVLAYLRSNVGQLTLKGVDPAAALVAKYDPPKWRAGDVVSFGDEVWHRNGDVSQLPWVCIKGVRAAISDRTMSRLSQVVLLVRDGKPVSS